MQESGYELPRIHLLGTSVNKGKKDAGAAESSGILNRNRVLP